MTRVSVFDRKMQEEKMHAIKKVFLMFGEPYIIIFSFKIFQIFSRDKKCSFKNHKIIFCENQNANEHEI